MVKFDLPRGYSLILIGFDNTATSRQSWRVESVHEVCHSGGDITAELPQIITDICRGHHRWGRPVYDDQSTDSQIALETALIMVKVANLLEHYNSLLTTSSSDARRNNIRKELI